MSDAGQRARLVPKPGPEHRCPYCHDLLDTEEEPRLACDGCGTLHHQVCLQELGRCTVMGCDRPLDPAAARELPPATSRVLRLIRQRHRERARRFVARNTVKPEDRPPEPSPASVPYENAWRDPHDPLALEAYQRKRESARKALRVVVGVYALLVLVSLLVVTLLRML